MQYRSILKPLFLFLLLATVIAAPRFTNHAATGGAAPQDAPRFEASDLNGYVIQLDAQGNRLCRDVLPSEQETLLKREPGAKLHVISSIQPNQSGGLRIILRGTDQLEQFPAAKAAFQAAAAKWEAIITSQITVVLDVDFGPTRFGTPYPPRVLGSTATQTLTTAEGGFAGIRRALVDRATGDTETALVNGLPATAVPTDLGNTTRVSGTSAQLRALGLIPAVADPANEPANFGPPPSVGFNSNNGFDFDPGDGIDRDKFDFDATAVHEIGHALGFVSAVGTQEIAPTAPVAPSIWDLFRFRPGIATSDLATAQRVLRTGGFQNFFTYNGAQIPLSTGNPRGENGDRSQASHWRERGLNGQFIGIMDPNGAPGDRDVLTNNDILAVDTFGYSVNNPFTPPDTTPPTVSNVTPSGGEAFNVGDRITISWTSSDNARLFSHAINLSRNGGETFPVSVATGIAGSAQTFTWTAPFGTDGTRVRVRVTAFDTSYLGGSAASSGDFTIQGVQGSGPAPANLTATAAGNNVNLAWQAPPTPAGAGDAKLIGTTKLRRIDNRAVTRKPVVAESLAAKSRKKSAKSLETNKTVVEAVGGKTFQPNQNDTIPLTSGTAVRGTIEAPPAGSGVLAATQFSIEVPAGATQLKVDLDGGAADTDLFVRFGQRVTLAGGRVQADAGSTGDTGQESITLTSSSTPALRTGGTYFIALANFGPGAANFSLTATVTTGSQPPPPPTGDTVALTSGTPVQGSISAPTQGGGGVLGATQYTIVVPPNTGQLRIELNGNPQDVDLFARFGERVAIANGRVQADAGSTGDAGTEVITLSPTSSPVLRTGTYFIAVANFGPGVANFTLSATAGPSVTPPPPSGDTVPLTSGTPATGTAAGPGNAAFLLHPTQYTITVPDGTTSLRVELRGNPAATDIDLYVRFGQRVSIQGSDLFADYTSEGLDGNEAITIDATSTPPLRAGNYFIAINNFGPGASNFTVTATIGNQPAGPRLTGYNVYRSTASPVPVNGDTRIATVAATTTRFSDTPPGANGQTRFNYVVTAIYDNAVESGPSNEASASPGTGGGGGGNVVELTSGQPATGNIAAPPPNTVLLSGTQYTIAVPTGATRLQVQVSGNTDVDLYVRFGNRVDVANGEIVADFISETEESSETINISSTTSPALRAGTYFIGVGNFGPGAANFTLTATVTGGSRDPDSTAPTVRLIAPNGGERVRAGAALTVQWDATDNIGVASQDILLSTDSGATYPTRIATGLGGNVRSFSYTVPGDQARARTARVRVVARDAAGNSGTASSAADFRIRPARN